MKKLPLQNSTNKRYQDVEKGLPIKITRWDMHPLDFNRESMLEWLVWSGYVDSYITSHLKNQPYLEDYRQEIWLQIIEKADRLVDIFNYEGKGKFTNFIKMMINNNIISGTSPSYRHIRRDRETKEVYFNDDGWDIIDRTFDPADDYYKQIDFSAENAFDDLYTKTNSELADGKHKKK